MPGHYQDNRFFIGDFDDELENSILIPLTKEIAAQSKLKDGNIDLYINSMGGYAHLTAHIVELVELAKAQGVTVRTIVPNMAFSAGSILAITGTPGERYISKSAEHLIHYGQIASMESTPQQVERYRKWKERYFKATVAHYKRYSDIPGLDQEILDDGWFIPAKDCLRYKLADKYIDKLEL
jgi:ATP-dependent protease ClpP protease subunit